MRESAERTLSVARAVVAAARSDDVTFLAAAIAYYGFVSLVPLLLLALAVATTLGGETLALRVVGLAGQLLTEEAQQLVRTVITAEAGRGEATVVGLAGLTWSSLKVFRGLDKSFSIVYDTPSSKSFVDAFRDGLIVLVAIGGGVAALATAVVLVSTVATPVVTLFAPVGLFVLLIVVFFPMYYFFPDDHLAPTDALPGAVLAAGGWSVLGRGLQVYAEVAGSYALYGVIGAVLLVLTWLYLGALVVMLGAVLNAVLSGPHRSVDRQLQQDGVRQETSMSDDASGDDDREDADAGSDGGGQEDTDDYRDAGGGSGGPPPAGDDGGSEPSGSDTDDDGPVEFDAGHRETGPRDGPTSVDDEPKPGDLEREIDQLRDQLRELREDHDEFEDDVTDRTVDRDRVESDLKRYVRRRLRRGHARGWGPYLVLLYGTAMTIGGFFYLSGVWAVLAMLVVWTSTLGVYVLMVLTGIGLNLLAIPWRARDRVGEWRSD